MQCRLSIEGDVMQESRLGRTGRALTRRRAPRALVIAGALVSLLAAACSSGGSGTKSGSVTLVVQNGAGGATGLLAAYDKLNKQFEADHPGVKIQFVTKSFDEVVSTSKLQLSGSNPPDVTQTNQGYQAMGAFVKAGLLTNLDQYASKYDWTKRQSSALLELNGHFSTDGVKMGEGPLWGISVTNAWIGLLMNSDVAAQLGISAEPKTFAELEQDLATAKAKGVVPFQFGSSNGEMPAWLLSELLLAKGGPAAVNDIVFHRNDPTFKSPTAAWAATTIKSWADKGYFTPNWTAYKTDEAFSKFAGGKGLFGLGGSWLMPIPGTPEQTKKFRMVVFPSVSGDGPNAVAAGDMPWTIPAHSKHHDLAAEYINFISSDTSADVLLTSGNMPSFSPGDLNAALASANLPSPSQDAIRNGIAVIGKGSPVPFIDWGAPDLYDAIKSNFDKLASGSMSVDDFQSHLQDAFGPFVQSLK
ncbi:MAG: raffinose/stachyose/melibiose transport system substrate-binding protein [Pseudonocardiales bacterium]|nr:raffinose/stachyose/melibiose transport system substrate-binding protein [Pseudonocardiales bacterium]